MRRAVAFAPATVANVSVGFDVLGFALSAPGDRIAVAISDDDGVVVEAITGIAEVPADSAKNTASVALSAMRQDLGLDYGFRLSIHKGIPVSSGLGGSAASAVGAVVAANALLSEPLPTSELLGWALRGEAAASGAEHADNVAPCLMGGLCAALSDPIEILSLPVPAQLHYAVVRPHLQVETRAARAALRPTVALHEHVRQSSRLVGFVAACFRGDVELLRRCMVDDVIEPQRAAPIRGFADVQNAALAAGALGCSIAGSGPAVFAWATSQASGEAVRTAIVGAFANHRLACDDWVGPMPAAGARVES